MRCCDCPDRNRCSDSSCRRDGYPVSGLSESDEAREVREESSYRLRTWLETGRMPEKKSDPYEVYDDPWY